MIRTFRFCPRIAAELAVDLVGESALKAGQCLLRGLALGALALVVQRALGDP